MIIPPKENKIKNEFLNVNNELLELRGELDEEQARITLAKFLRANLGFTCEMISGIKLAKYQELNLNALFQINYAIMVWSRGASKSFLAAVFCYMYCLFNKNTKIIIAGPTFRTARFIFGKLDEIVTSKSAELLEQAMPVTGRSRKNDCYQWAVNGGMISAIPLAGEKIRGFRANVLIIDEANWVEQEMVEKVLMPFLVSPRNLTERIKTKEKEDKLIAEGKMKEEERTFFASDIKMIMLSSAGYTFEYLYTLYCDYLKKIKGEESIVGEDQEFAKEDIKYFVSQISWAAVPEEMMDKTVIKQASKGGNLSQSFKMEYGAQFCDGSDSYFNAKKMEDCTLRVGEHPHTLIRGNPDKKYILSVDPNASDSPTADYFAFSLFELDEEKEQGILVHGYQGLGDISNHAKYCFYLLQNFNIVMIMGDSAGLDTFLSTCNNSDEFINHGINLKYLEFDTLLEGSELEAHIAQIKNQYNVEGKRYVIRQHFSTDFIRRANEHLQTCIEYKRIWFASATVPNESIVNSQIDIADKLPKVLFENNKRLKDLSPLDFIDLQDSIIKQTKRQAATIEFTSTSKGSMNFDLPQHMQRINSPDKPRKDNYSSLFIGNWAVKSYFMLKKQPDKKPIQTWIPKILK